MIHILKFAGWTFGRWAYAAAWHKRVYGTLPDPDVDTALALQRKWQQAHPGHDPWAGLGELGPLAHRPLRALHAVGTEQDLLGVVGREGGCHGAGWS